GSRSMGALDGPVGDWIVANTRPGNRCGVGITRRALVELERVGHGPQVTEADWRAVKDFVLVPTVAAFEVLRSGWRQRSPGARRPPRRHPLRWCCIRG